MSNDDDDDDDDDDAADCNVVNIIPTSTSRGTIAIIQTRRNPKGGHCN